MNKYKKAFDDLCLLLKTCHEMYENKKDSPTVIMFIGVNGVGKTTSLAKFAQLMLKKNKTVVFAASLAVFFYNKKL